jgi:hypothetical protein
MFFIKKVGKMKYEEILQENHGKEVIIMTRDDHHYQGQLVGCQCRNKAFECSHLIVLLFGNNYVDVAVEDITEVKVLKEDSLQE